MALPLNIDDLIHQRTVEGALIEHKKDRNVRELRRQMKRKYNLKGM